MEYHDYASANIPSIVFMHITTSDYKNAEVFLKERPQQSRTIPGTQKLNCFIPVTKNTVKEEKVSLSETGELLLEEINGFVTAVQNDQWWIGCVHYIAT